MNTDPGQMLAHTRLTVEELKAAVEQSRRVKISLWDLLMQEKKVDEDAIADAFSAWLRLPRIRLASVNIEPDALARVRESLAITHLCVPVRIERRSLLLAMANPADDIAIQDLQFACGLNIRPLVASRAEIHDAITRWYAPEDELSDFLSHIADTAVDIVGEEERDTDLDERGAAAEAPVIKLANLILSSSISEKASDVHIEPGLNAVLVRLRIDGMLREHMQVPKWMNSALVARLKILAKLDIAERRVPQDGRIKVNVNKRVVEFRVSTLPTQFGEKIVMRVLGSSELPPLEVLGYSPEQIETLDQALGQPQGMMLVTGPTGSGKSSSLYAMLKRKKSPEINIITVEDPIEYQLPGISQVQVNPKAGLSFASALRSILRQDPDVILVGEIRDLETAEVSFHAAMTGHLVLSTLHTNSAVATIARLLDMGIDPFLISSSVSVVTAQRLARRNCSHCPEAYVPSGALVEKLRVTDPDQDFYRGRGCPECDGSGFSGRVGIYEIVRMTPALKELVNRRGSEEEMRKVVGLAGTRFLLEDAFDKVRQGVTTVEEVLRVIQLEETDIVNCPNCRAFINRDFSTCPYCLHTLRHLCEHCGQELAQEWKVCPYCNRSTSHHGRAALPAGGATAAGGEGSKPLSPGAEAPPAAAATQPILSAGDGLDPGGSATAIAEADADGATVELDEAGGEPVVKKPLILVVDDDPGIRQILVKTFDQLPIACVVKTASDGLEALEAVEREIPDLIVLDVMMPRMDGFTVCQRLRADVRTAFIPIMMLTANADENSRTRGFLVGTDDYLGKPFSFPELIARVMRLLRRTYGL